jgi:hypothetical protein
MLKKEFHYMDHIKKSTTNLPFKSLGSLFDLINCFSSSYVKALGCVCACLIKISSNFDATNLRNIIILENVKGKNSKVIIITVED